MSRKYRNPPIIEALCEFQFIPSAPWDLAIPGLMYEKVKEDFPNRKQQLGIDFQFRPSEKGLMQKVEPAPPRIQFHRKDGSALVQLAPDLLVINQLKPYPGWEGFKPLILRNLQIYRELADPKGFRRVGLRYINRINIPSRSIDLSNYFNFYPEGPEELSSPATSFLSRVEIPHVEERDRVIITISSTEPEEKESISVILDIDYIMNKPEGIRFEESKEWTEKAHSTIEDVFESCIREKCRALFGEIQ